MLNVSREDWDHGIRKMNWIALIAALSLVTVVLAIITDVQMTTCREGSLYRILHICRVSETHSNTPFECRFENQSCQDSR
jgi:hypothetical protein